MYLASNQTSVSKAKMYQRSYKSDAVYFRNGIRNRGKIKIKTIMKKIFFCVIYSEVMYCVDIMVHFYFY